MMKKIFVLISAAMFVVIGCLKCQTTADAQKNTTTPVVMTGDTSRNATQPVSSSSLMILYQAQRGQAAIYTPDSTSVKTNSGADGSTTGSGKNQPASADGKGDNSGKKNNSPGGSPSQKPK